MRKILSFSFPLLILIFTQWLIFTQESYLSSNLSLDIKGDKEFSITVFYQLTDYSEKKSASKTITGSENYQTVLFPVPSEKISKIRITLQSLNDSIYLNKISFYNNKDKSRIWAGNSLINDFPVKHKMDFTLLEDKSILIEAQDNHFSFESKEDFQALFKNFNLKKPSFILIVLALLFSVFIFLILNHEKTRLFVYRILFIQRLKSLFGKENIFIILFFVFASLIQLAAYFSIPSLIWNRTGLSRYVLGIDLLNLFFIENILMALITIWILYKGLWSKILSVILFIAFSLINSFQFLSVYISNEFINEEALMNTGNMGIITNSFTLSVVALPALFSLSVFVFLFIWHRPFSANIKQRITSSALLLAVAAGIYFAHLIPNLFLNKKNPLEMSSPIANSSPLISIVKTLWNSFAAESPKKFTKEDSIELKAGENFFTRTQLSESDLKIAASYGIQINPQQNYPFVKDFIYKEKLPFSKKKNLKKPNVIVLFIESLSARKVGVYGVPYQGLTPNIDDFAKKSMIVDEYYGHVQTTNRALKGQMCSMFPTYGYKQWLEKRLDMGAVYCLPHVMNEEGYKTVYLSHDSPTNTHLDYQMSCYGFQEAYFKHDFSKKFLNNENPVLKKNYDFWPAWGLSDHQMFRGLINYLKKSSNEKKPFFIAMSTIETHFMLDISADGVKYKDGKQPVLNTTHNLDHAFGQFWEYFKSSPYYENTIIILTADHSHFPDADYTPIAGPDYKKIFCDKIALIIYNPVLQLPEYYKANANSLDFTPSMLHMLNTANRKNPFMGLSLFSERKAVGKTLGFTSNIVYDLNKEQINAYQEKNKNPESIQALFRIIQYAMEVEISERVWPGKK